MAKWIPDSELVNISDENTRIDKSALSTRRTRGIADEIKNDPKRNKMILKYNAQDGSQVVLEVINENKDSIDVVLDKANKNYLLTLSSRKAGKY